MPYRIVSVISGNRAYIPGHQIEAGARQWRTAANPGKGLKMNFARSFNNWRKYRQTVNELGRMSDRELSDLGIGRGDIAYVARQAVK